MALYMDYELIMKLSSARFPTKTKLEYVKYIQNLEEREESLSYPTLSELITACGNNFRMLLKQKECDVWEAYPIKGSDTECYGKTPEEAVAKLWLQIHSDYGLHK